MADVRNSLGYASGCGAQATQARDMGPRLSRTHEVRVLRLMRDLRGDLDLLRFYVGDLPGLSDLDRCLEARLLAVAEARRDRRRDQGLRGSV